MKRSLLTTIIISVLIAIPVSAFAGSAGPIIASGSLSVSGISENAAQVSWMTDEPSDSTVQYGVGTANMIYTSPSARCDGTTLAINHCVNLAGLLPGTLYYIVAISGNGTGTPGTSGGSFTTAVNGDTVPPSPPSSPSATTHSSTEIHVYWGAATDNIGVTAYKVFRNGVFLTSINNGQPLSFFDAGLLPNTQYGYYIKAADAAGNESSQTPVIYATTFSVATQNADVQAPTTPTGLVANELTSSSVALRWGASSDNVGVTGYRVYRSGGGSSTVVPLGTVSSLDYRDMTVTAGLGYYYAVTALDASVNESPTSTAVFVNVPAAATTTMTVAPPNAPVLLGSEGANSVVLTWTESTIPVDGFKLYKQIGGLWTDIGNVSGGQFSYTDQNLPVATYSYKVQAFVNQQNSTAPVYSDPSNVISISIGARASTTASTTSATTQQTLPTPSVVLLSVSPQTSYCDNGAAKTPVVFSALPVSGAYFRITQVTTEASSERMSGTYLLPNGQYAWTAFSYPGFTLGTTTGGNFSLFYPCVATASTTTAIVNSTAIATGISSTPLPTASIVLRGESVVHVPFRGYFVDPGADAFVDGESVKYNRPLGDYRSSIPGTYDVRYDIPGKDGVVLASTKRIIIVDPPPETTASTSPDIQRSFASTSATVVPPQRQVTPFPASPQTITTQNDFARYCDDPNHTKECQAYATIPMVQYQPPAPIVPVISEDRFSAVVAEVKNLPGGAKTPDELASYCTQSSYATECAELLVAARLADKEEAMRRVEKLERAKALMAKILDERIGARIFQDTDTDGVSDYDEVNLYHTDPRSADTNGNGTNDSSELFAGLDPAASAGNAVSSTTTVETLFTVFMGTTTGFGSPVAVRQQIPFENPRYGGDAKPELLRVTDVRATTREEAIPATREIVLEGKAPANSFVTLYIFSDPIVVTVKTDAQGNWTYTLDKELPDGTHSVYSAITDAGGRILAKSEPLPFVKTAQAVTIGGLPIVPQEVEPGFFSGVSLVVMTGIIAAALFTAFFLIGIMIRRREAVTDAGGIVDLTGKK